MRTEIAGGIVSRKSDARKSCHGGNCMRGTVSTREELGKNCVQCPGIGEELCPGFVGTVSASVSAVSASVSPSSFPLSSVVRAIRRSVHQKETYRKFSGNY